ncbi:MAG TPA: pilus assembly protein PilM, partial [Candidatus Saccharimonadales bacterium]|nr:pilus assembly protein PilM [Candidatus Saccharimonadales bacterium]
MKSAKTPVFFHDKPLFGMDIGHGSLKVMQVEERSKASSKDRHHKVIGYGFAHFDKSAQRDGVVIQPEVIAQAALDLFQHNLIGDITTGRVALAIPAYRTFSRALQLPTFQAKEMREAVELEAEQYISMPLEELYVDYEVVKQTDDSTSLFLVAVPKIIVDSYLDLARIMGLETVLIESTLNSSGRLFSLDSNSGDPALVIDFGSQSSDISIFDQHMLVAGTVQGGG